MVEPDRALARKLAAESLARGDATGWFEALYHSAAGNATAIPWADGNVNPNLAQWLATQAGSPPGQRALVIGCGLGDDAEHLARLGLDVTAFDISTTAVQWCQLRFPTSAVKYRAADLLAPPAEWRRAFEFVFEAYTLQVLPPELRPTAAANLAQLVAPGGTLLVIARARDAGEPPGTMPWPLTREDLAPITGAGLIAETFEDYLDAEQPPVRRFRIAYRRPQ